VGKQTTKVAQEANILATAEVLLLAGTLVASIYSAKQTGDQTKIQERAQNKQEALAGEAKHNDYLLLLHDLAIAEARTPGLVKKQGGMGEIPTWLVQDDTRRDHAIWIRPNPASYEFYLQFRERVKGTWQDKGVWHSADAKRARIHLGMKEK
jgi:hypothetical protein